MDQKDLKGTFQEEGPQQDQDQDQAENKPRAMVSLICGFQLLLLLFLAARLSDFLSCSSVFLLALTPFFLIVERRNVSVIKQTRQEAAVWSLGWSPDSGRVHNLRRSQNKFLF